MNYEMLRDILRARPKSFAFLAFLAFLNLALVMYLSQWQRPELAKTQSAWFAKRDALASGQSVGVATRYEMGSRDLALFQKRFIAKKEFPAFLSRLFDSAKGNGLAVKGISYKPTPVKEEPTLLSYGISFTVSGKYPSLKKFIADLSRYPEMVTVDSVSLSNSSHTEESVDLKVQVTAYLKKEGA